MFRSPRLTGTKTPATHCEPSLLDISNQNSGNSNSPDLSKPTSPTTTNSTSSPRKLLERFTGGSPKTIMRRASRTSSSTPDSNIMAAAAGSGTKEVMSTSFNITPMSSTEDLDEIARVPAFTSPPSSSSDITSPRRTTTTTTMRLRNRFWALLGIGNIEEDATSMSPPPPPVKHKQNGFKSTSSSCNIDCNASDEDVSTSSPPPPAAPRRVPRQPSILSLDGDSMTLRFQVLEAVLDSPTFQKRLRDHMAKSFCSENVELLASLKAFDKSMKLWITAHEIVEEFLLDSSAKQVLLSEELRLDIQQAHEMHNLSRLIELFVQCETEVMRDLRQAEAFVSFLKTLSEADVEKLMGELDLC